MADRPGPLKEAFYETANIAGMTAVAAVSLAMVTPVPLLAGLVAEAAYLLFVPDSRWYHSKRKARQLAAEMARKEALKREILPILRPEMEARYRRLEKMRADIAGQTVEGQTWFTDLVGKLDYLLEKFLLFARSEVQFRNYLRSVQEEMRGQSRPVPPPQVDERIPVNDKRGGKRNNVPPPQMVNRTPVDPSNRWVADTIAQVSEHYAKEIAALKSDIESEKDPDTKAVLEKRSDVLERRQEHLGKIGKILTNLNHQLELLEDSFGLINDQIRARSPEQILADVDEMVWQTDTMTQVLEEITPYEQLIARL